MTVAPHDVDGLAVVVFEVQAQQRCREIRRQDRIGAGIDQSVVDQRHSVVRGERDGYERPRQTGCRRWVESRLPGRRRATGTAAMSAETDVLGFAGDPHPVDLGAGVQLLGDHAIRQTAIVVVGQDLAVARSMATFLPS
jgi:hypothetical protein